MPRVIHTINLVVGKNLWMPIQISRGGLTFSQLTFADNLFLFAETSVVWVDVINYALRNFCESSGAKVNEEKIRIFFLKNVNWHIKEETSAGFDFQCNENLGKYPGVPIFHKTVSSQTFNYATEKVDKRLDS